MSKKSKDLNRLFQYIDATINDYIDVLKEAVSIVSISNTPNYRGECFAMINWVVIKLKSLGFQIEQVNFRSEAFPRGQLVQRPPIILASLECDSSKPTVCFYGHLDICPVGSEPYDPEAEPFKLIYADGVLSGAGVSNNKGPVICWLNAIHAYNALKIPYPVNIKLILGCFSHNGRFGLAEVIQERKLHFFGDVDVVCLSNNYRFSESIPSLTHSVLGICMFHITILPKTCCGYGGRIINQCIADILYLLDGLVDRKGKILIPNIYDNMIPITNEERRGLLKLRFSMSHYESEYGMSDFHDGSLLLRRWKYPSLTIHTIQSCPKTATNRDLKTKSALAKFSVRLAPGQSPEDIEKIVLNFMKDRWNERNSKNTFKIHMAYSRRPWMADISNKTFKAAHKAAQFAYGVMPASSIEGGRYPEPAMFHCLAGKDVILLPLASDKNTVHSGSESFKVDDYSNGTKFICAFLHELPLMKLTTNESCD